MSTQTTNYELIKPADNETADIAVINENYDRIDAALSPTADPEQAPVGNGPGKLAQWVSWTANRIKAILGTTNWYDVPPTNLQVAADHISAASPHAGHARTSDLAAHLADYTKQIPFATTLGSANAYTAFTDPALPDLVAGVAITVKIHAVNTGVSTLDWNGKGAKAIKKPNGNDVAAGGLKLNGVYTLRYDGVNFILQGERGEYGTATAAEVLSGYTLGTESGVINGTLELTGDAVTANVLSGKTFYNTNAKTKLSGSMPTKGAQTYTPGTANQTISAGQYLSGTQTIEGDADLVAENIKSGISIFGVTGSLTSGKKWAKGQQYNNSGEAFLTVNGLTFQPSLVVMHWSYSQSWSINGNFSVGSTTDNMTIELRVRASHDDTNDASMFLPYATGFTMGIPSATYTGAPWDWIAFE